MDLNLSDCSNVSLPAIRTSPTQFACMSISEDREVHANSTECLGINLKAGLREYRRRVGSDPFHDHPNRLDRTLKMCLDSDSVDEILASQIVTHRSIMTKLLYGAAQQLNSTDPEPDRIHTFVRDGECIGSNFEALCTGGSPNGVTFNLGDLKVVFAGEVDCQKDSNVTGQAKDCLELKTKCQGSKQAPAKLRWYFQSSLIGVPTIVLGWHKEGVLTAVDMIDVATMVDETILQQRYDSAAIFLTSLRRHCMAHAMEKEDNPIWRLITKSGLQRRPTIRALNSEEVQSVK
ncbi:uncharacterized protein EV420DRAFT_1548542 [Desarmillaria tabescens]|uniref:Decapping nuclease n=1 Tax=Armillaria tabescens TaxID=1929756 RepID=A0AA39KAB3_ARMTA|nr:uncharacterized protein EV420DRAFT_1548542 [Desarmillaria tabescens]KAK0457491.1 hypothetical protein EV420DRAFT_1548542 [Desarmillaria tabescens]